MLIWPPAVAAQGWAGSLVGKGLHAGRVFATVTDKSWNVRREAYHGYNWFALECRKGERRAHDNPAVDRIGLDGYPDPFPAGSKARIAFSFMPREHVLAAAPGQWTNFFELHSTTLKGDREQAGPLIFVSEWSAAAGRNVFRIRRNRVSKGANGLVTGLAGSDVLYQGEMYQYGTYDFVVETGESRTGSIRVWLNGRMIVDRAGAIGYGDGRRLYPQFRIYRGARTETARALVRIDDVKITW